ncbi:MAG: hypothetical protein FJW34_14675 [Acidobacteria bacterium]|nr:hypothetical protein [Acidobacteriota bacterium]
MHIWSIPLTLLCATGIALAADPAPAPQPAAVPAVEQAAPAQPARMQRHKVKRLPRGDLRHCLELKDDKALIACAERRRKQ